ncbi:sulfate/molybdate ABC transporter ATP-binding protein [Nocardioides deserti]|uniref:ABC transporter ATP-binding protein n=1 Tax=Nocardioides deserti TaxID=1588644 RepID=A0ABR6U7M9_9ACTN|nr:ABC transporter ATP-binding protein [Nocardioides deserti]MBC2960380.1 ABC transporter ATP-binding protein [Nocardioides deserti]GGO71565.1 molybdenum ABC transporter ATP-binding protein [Nocardioides deserti]
MTLLLEATVADRGVDVALEVAAGETVALLGPNGAGKSTVLAVAAGLLRPDTGTVRLDDHELTGGRVVPPHARRTALLAQDPLLFPHLTALDNVAFGPRSAGVRRRAARDSARRWLAEVGAADLAGRRPGELSGGQAQRVAVARALAAEPRLLLLDEPMAALDVAVTPALRQTLRRVLEGRTTVVVTHDVLDALLLADRVVVLDRGRVVEQGPAADVLARPRSPFAARIAGLNLVAGRWSDGAVRSDDGRVVAGTPSGPVLREGDPAVAVFRPRAVSVFRDPPGGSPRTALAVVVTDLEPHGDQVRVRAGDLAADVTAHAAAELDLAPGTPVTFSVKATEVDVYAR